MTAFAVLPPTVRSYIGDFVTRRRRVRLVRAAGIVTAVFLFWMLGWCVFDRLIPLPGWMRLILLSVGLVSLVVLLLRPLREALARRVDWVTAAGEIESRNPAFAERLQTVTSRLLGPSEQRGSPELITHLLGQVEAQVRDDQPRRLMPWAHAVRGWLPATALLVLILALSLIPWLDLPRLMLRFVAPLAAVAPATTTRIDASHTPDQVIQGEPISFRATASNLGDGGLRLHLSHDGRNWSTRAMAPAGEGFAFVLPAADRDFRYAVSGGDARTPTRLVPVLRRPAIVEFRIRYTYPDYTQRPPLTVSNTDGTLEAPAGTEASIAIAASERLADAKLLVGGKEMDTQPTVEPTVRQAKLRITQNESWELKMTSSAGAEGGLGGMVIRALPDRPPIVRLVQPAEDLRLTPRDVVSLRYLAMDDFGLESVKIVAAINGTDRQQSSLNLRGDPRRQEGAVEFDLATLQAQIGDIVRVRFEARDRSGQTASSDPRHILISPRSIDMNTHLRLADLRQAESLAQTLQQELKATREAYQKIPADQREFAEGWQVTGEYDQHLVSASEAGLLLRQTLLRATMRSTSPEMSTTLANLIDNAQLAGSLADHTVARAPLSDAGAVETLLSRAQDKAQKLDERLQTLLAGEQAAAIAADRANIEALAKRDTLDEAARRTLARAREDVAAGAKALKLSPDAPDLDQQLQAKVEAMRRFVKELPPIDFAEVSKPWAERPEDVKTPVALAERLSAAAQAEAVRPDSDLLRARDLQLASQAAQQMSERVVVVKAGEVRRPEELKEYPAALAALQQEHQLNRRSQDVRDPAETQRVAAEAEAARKKLRQWAGLEDPSRLARADQEQMLAMESSLREQQKQYDEARMLDDALARTQVTQDAAPQQESPAMRPASPASPSPSREAANAQQQSAQPSSQQQQQRREELAQSMRQSQRLDEIAASQRQIAEATAKRQAEQAHALAQQQQQVAEALRQAQEQARDPLDVVADEQQQPDTRGQAMAAIAQAQQRLAAMPQQLTETQEAAARQRQAQAAAQQAMQAARQAPAEQKPAAERVAEAAKQSAEQSTRQMNQTAEPVSPDVADAMARALTPFAPQTTPAVEALQTKLGGALRSLKQATDGGDAAATDRATAEARQAIRGVQEALRDAQTQLAEQDPLVAAQAFAREAAASLAVQPPDFERATESQSQAQRALSRAWQDSVRQSAQLRMAGVGSMRTLYEADLLIPLSGAGTGAGAAGDIAVTTGDREWGRARRREETDRTATGRESDPPGYQDALRAYFEALGQSGKEPKK